jgi:mannose-6-phosphate isomerase
MKNIGLLRNVVQEYAWGSKTAIAELLGKPVPSCNPQAELWMGAHSKAPSQVFINGRWRSLLDVLRESPREVLGKKAAEKYSGTLPFLFKILAAAKPLSIQAHPDKEQARSGFLRENRLGIPLDAPHRNYKDDNHKPEIICAVTKFRALNGFRPIGEILSLLNKIRVPALSKQIDAFCSRPNRKGLRKFFQALMTMDGEPRLQAVQEIAASDRVQDDGSPIWKWMTELNREYPGDIGILAPVLLNLLELEPGDAMYLPAGHLHAYLHGVAIELMANSDNVLRGGLTSKHIDIDELLNILNFSNGKPAVLKPKKKVPPEAFYNTPAAEFALSVIDVDTAAVYRSAKTRSVEIMICTQGNAEITELPDGLMTKISKGISLLVPAAVKQYTIQGCARIYKAAVPLRE